MVSDCKEQLLKRNCWSIDFLKRVFPKNTSLTSPMLVTSLLKGYPPASLEGDDQLKDCVKYSHYYHSNAILSLCGDGRMKES